MEGIGNALAGAMFTLVVLGLILGAVVVGGTWFLVDKDYIESKTIIIPEKRLEADGVKVDTIYIYKENN